MSAGVEPHGVAHPDSRGRGAWAQLALGLLCAGALLTTGDAYGDGHERGGAEEWLAPPAAFDVRSDDHLPPWGDAPLPAWAQSAHVLQGDEPIVTAPGGGGKRRGSAARETHLPLFAQRLAPGCNAPWLQVGAQAWLCGAAVEVSGNEPVPAGALPVTPGGDGLPFRYYFVNGDGSFAYSRIEEVDVGEPAMQLEGGFAVAVIDERVLGHEAYGRTNRGLWVPMRDLHPANPLVFQGAELDGTTAGGLPVAWVVSERAPRYVRSGQGFVASGRSEARFFRVAVSERAQSFAGSYLRDADGDWFAARDLREPSVAPPPPEVDAAGGERWIDVELATQTLVAYEGERPVFATLVSTGKGAQGSGNATPKGTHRIWIKLFTSVMDNLEDEDAARYYRMEDVPYVQYFSKGVGLHAAYWHHSFGRVRSHGCVNLAPLDAARLFRFTLPHMPGGWTAVLPTDAERATIVRVR